MIITRKYFSEEENKRSKPSAEQVGEALGITVLGAGGTYAGSKLVSKGMRNLATNYESKQAVKNYRNEARKLMQDRIAKDKTVSDNVKINRKVANRELDRAIEKHENSLFGKKKTLRKAEQNLVDTIERGEQTLKTATKRNKAAYQRALRNLRSKVIANKNKNISKVTKRGRIGSIIGGTAATGLAVASKLRNKDNNK